MLAINDLKQLIRIGGSVRLHAGHYSVLDIQACARIASGSKASITVAHAEYISASDMNAIARIAPGQVVFDLVGPQG